MVRCIKLIHACFANPVHGLKKTTITQTQNKTKIHLKRAVEGPRRRVGRPERNLGRTRPQNMSTQQTQQKKKTPQPDVDRHAEAGDRDHYDDDEFPDLLKDL